MKRISIFLIRVYKKIFSPMLNFLGVHCKYYPTCSEYAVLAIEKYGFIKGWFLSFKRISKGGYDPLK